jgi:hypothetical protein
MRSSLPARPPLSPLPPRMSDDGRRPLHNLLHPEPGRAEFGAPADGCLLKGACTHGFMEPRKLRRQSTACEALLPCGVWGPAVRAGQVPGRWCCNGVSARTLTMLRVCWSCDVLTPSPAQHHLALQRINMHALELSIALSHLCLTRTAVAQRHQHFTQSAQRQRSWSSIHNPRNSRLRFVTWACIVPSDSLYHQTVVLMCSNPHLEMCCSKLFSATNAAWRCGTISKARQMCIDLETVYPDWWCPPGRMRYVGTCIWWAP